MRTFKLLAVVFSFCATPVLLAQSGSSYFADFELTGRGRANEVFNMTQDSEGNIAMATQNGVVVFDGSNSSLVGTGAYVYSLKHIAENGKTYVGCDGKIGFIQKNNFGKYVFTKIALKEAEEQAFTTIVTQGQDAYLQSSDWVVKVTNDKVTAKWKRPREGNFSGLFVLQNVLFVNVSTSGLYKLQENGKVSKHQVADGALAEEEVYFAIPRGKSEVVLGTSANQLFLFNGASLSVLPNERSNYLADKYLNAGERVDNTHMVLATLSGGLVVLNMYNGQLSEEYNTAHGFPDDQIKSITVDKNRGIWASHDMGITRIDRQIPIKLFSSYPGLNNRAYSVAEANGTVYVGASDGLYRLKAAESAEEYNRTVEQTQAARKKEKAAIKAGVSKTNIDDEKEEETSAGQTTTVDPSVRAAESDPENKTEENVIDRAGKRIKNIIRRAKEKGDKVINGEDEGEANPGTAYYLNENIVKPKGIFRLAGYSGEGSPQYIYSKIPGIDGKVRKIIVTPSGLFCLSNTGLFLYNGSQVVKVSAVNIKDASYCQGKIVYTTISGAYLYNEGGSSTLITYNPKHKNMYNVFYENPNTIWLGGMNKVLRLTVNADGAVSKETAIEVPAEYMDYMSIAKSGSMVYFVSSNGAYEFVPGNNTAVLSSLSPSDNQSVFEFCTGPVNHTLYFQSQEGWREVKANKELENMGLLDVVSDVRYVYKNNSGGLWAVNAEGKIFYLNKNIPAGGYDKNFNVFIRGVSGISGNSFDLSDLSISYQDATVEIKWGSDLFVKTDGTWYQYKIENLGRGTWSQWTKQTSLKIQLNPGSYTFVVRARDVMGNISPERELKIYIKPPFWQTWYFYLFLAAVLGGVGYLIFRWRNRALIENQKRLELMVKERTEQLEMEKEKSEVLLLNILPNAVAKELKESGHSSVRRHADSAVMFTDFCNFTKMSMGMSAEELVEKLDMYFREFDKVVEKYGLEKIKTIGDAYMCASGVPQPKHNGTVAIVMAAIEILEVVRTASSHWHIRIGIHQGSLVSGVVGKKKFAYDIWGETVNIASRMESSSEPMQINITEDVYNQIKEYFDCEKRGEIEAKSLGKTNMYFVKGLKEKYSSNGKSNVPNHSFMEVIK